MSDFEWGLRFYGSALAAAFLVAFGIFWTFDKEWVKAVLRGEVKP